MFLASVGSRHAKLYPRISSFKLGLKTVPPTLAKTQMKQVWHVPSRRCGIHPRAVPFIRVQKAVRKHKSTAGITSSLYNPVQVSLVDVCLDKRLIPAMRTLEPQPLALTLWAPPRADDHPVLPTIFGDVPKVFPLSYQLPRPVEENAQLNIIMEPAPPPPPFVLPQLPLVVLCALPHGEQQLFESLEVSQEQSMEYESLTRQQGETSAWHQPFNCIKVQRCPFSQSQFRNAYEAASEYQDCPDCCYEAWHAGGASCCCTLRKDLWAERL
ncbi:hypothetical protein CAPTEDRAFT_209256 [Capitella teleta]|uniref:Uncharacterized protein n=1 Tax=Capitella teleta TaxID=283909 RepID=R7UED5_CAPTE|nr:hypothetical protein CAPTEDRAFT_209256 [Capitella teleta]|eukprot:ELU02153.1 hypothetical protein CAPTEDRAFT_209256 [Capitella teleta]